MKHYRIKPDVAGGIAGNSVLDNSVFPPNVSRLHYEFDDWFGDDILASFPCFIVSDKLSMALNDSGMSGFKLDNCEISISGVFEDLHPEGLELPPFQWLKVIGKPGDDFWLFEGKRLCVSERAMQLLRNFNLKNAEIQEVEI